MATLQEITDRMKTAVGSDSGLGKSLKFNLKGAGFIFINGGTVNNDDSPADLTLTISVDDLMALGEGRLDPMTAVMTGALGLSDMGVAMGQDHPIRIRDFARVEMGAEPANTIVTADGANSGWAALRATNWAQARRRCLGASLE